MTVAIRDLAPDTRAGLAGRGARVRERRLDVSGDMYTALATMQTDAAKLRDAKAISHHYDVSNTFYERVLGPPMAYTCA